VDCWDGNVVVKKCAPESLVFDPIKKFCDWPSPRNVRLDAADQVKIQTPFHIEIFEIKYLTF